MNQLQIIILIQFFGPTLINQNNTLVILSDSSYGPPFLGQKKHISVEMAPSSEEAARAPLTGEGQKSETSPGIPGKDAKLQLPATSSWGPCHSHGAQSLAGWSTVVEIVVKWMMTRGTPIFRAGNHPSEDV